MINCETFIDGRSAARSKSDRHAARTITGKAIAIFRVELAKVDADRLCLLHKILRKQKLSRGIVCKASPVLGLTVNNPTFFGEMLCKMRRL